MLAEIAEETIADAAVVVVAEYRIGSDPVGLNDVAKEISMLGLVNRFPTNFKGTIAFLGKLPASIDPEVNVPFSPYSLVSCYSAAIPISKTWSTPAVSKLGSALCKKLEGWIDAVLLPGLSHRNVSYALVQFGDALHAKMADKIETQLRDATVAGYVARAKHWAGAGVESMLSLVYLHRAKAIRHANEGAARSVREKALSALHNALPLIYHLDLNIEPQIEPPVYSSAFLVGLCRNH